VEVGGGLIGEPRNKSQETRNKNQETRNKSQETRCESLHMLLFATEGSVVDDRKTGFVILVSIEMRVGITNSFHLTSGFQIPRSRCSPFVMSDDR
jgi:hypothetical protein